MASTPEDQPEGVGPVERRLTRLRYDLHDGPQQDLMLLADDLRRLRADLETTLDDEADRSPLLSQLDEIQGRLVRLDADLRRLAAFIQSPFGDKQSVPDALDELVQEFSARSGISPSLEVEGDFSELTHSQQIVVLNVVREALNNVREHSQAENVSIAVSSSDSGIDASVRDDGAGFEPEAMLAHATEDGHLGLAGMYERVRLLGGMTHIESRPGGPTEVSFSLPAWRPGG